VKGSRKTHEKQGNGLKYYTNVTMQDEKTTRKSQGTK